jgi:hypothetical protein
MHSTASFLRALALGGISTALPLSLLAQDANPSDWDHFGLNLQLGFDI